MLVYGERSAFVRRHAVESLNFQITLFIASWWRRSRSSSSSASCFCRGVDRRDRVLIIGGMAANRGEEYRYPINIRMVH